MSNQAWQIVTDDIFNNSKANTKCLSWHFNISTNSLVVSPTNDFPIHFQNLMNITFITIQQRLAWSQQNFAHTKTAKLSWYVQIFVVIRMKREKICANIFLSNLNLDQYFIGEMGALYWPAFVLFLLASSVYSPTLCNRSCMCIHTRHTSLWC